jgi:hypothetical protein
MSASARPLVGAKKIPVTFERREDGGLRVYSPVLPGFVLSHSDARLVIADVEPALAFMLSEMYSTHVEVERLTELAVELEDAGVIDPLPAQGGTFEYVAWAA